MFKNKKIIIVTVISAVIVCGFIIFEIKNKNETDINYENIIVETEEKIEEKEIDKNRQIETIKIHIAGQVKNPGIIELDSGSRISDAIEKAGGVTERANLDEINLAYILEDGQKLYIPNIEEKNKEYIMEENGENIIQETNSSGINKKIDINKSDKEGFESIPGIGPSMAEKIINYRNENGEFKSIDELKNVSGIGEKKFESMKEYICVK